MIRHIARKDIAVEKYNRCIEASENSRVYAFSWYLDQVTEDWELLVYGDYEIVMPLPIRKKYGIKYVYHPFWVLELGIFYCKKNKEVEQELLDYVSKKYLFSEFRLNTENIHVKSELGTICLFDLNRDYEEVYTGYRKDRKKDLRKAEKANLSFRWGGDCKDLLHLFRTNLGGRVSNILDADYQNLERIIEQCVLYKKGRILSVLDSEKKQIASGFFLRHKNKITILISATDFENRNNGANTFLIDTCVREYIGKHLFFDFGGSNIPTVAAYFNSFGTEVKHYDLFKSGVLSKIKKRS